MGKMSVELVTVAAILLLGAVLLAVSTWSKRRLMIRLLAVVEDGEAMTSWLASASEVRGVVDGRDVRIENVATTRGVLKISVEHRSSTRAKAFRQTRLRAALRKATQPDVELYCRQGRELYFRWESPGGMGAMEEARDRIVRFMFEHPSLDRLVVAERWVVAFRIGYRKRELDPEAMRRFLNELHDVARSLEEVAQPIEAPR